MSDLDRLLSSYLSGRLSRRAFIGRALGIGLGMGFIETILGPGARRALAGVEPGPYPSRAPYIVMVVMDAFRADYVDLAPLPNLHWLMNRGVHFPHAWVGQLESYTPTSHATLSTGATPAHQGIIGFSWRDPETGKEDLTCWYDDVMAGRMEQQLQQHNVNSIPAAVKTQDPHARIVALSVEKYYAADGLGAGAADYVFYGQPFGKKVVPRGIPHHVPPASFLGKPDLSGAWPMTYGQFDELAMTMALESLRSLDPRVLLINLPGADVYGHRVGGPASPDVMRKIAQACDEQLGRLFKTLRDRGILDQTIFIVTADHGMVGNTYQIQDQVIREAIKNAGGDPVCHVGGNSAYIWLKNAGHARSVAQRMVDMFPSLPLYRATDSLGVPFAHYLRIENGEYRYHPVTPAGTTIDAKLEAAYQYLLGTFAGPTAPDIALAYQEDMISSPNPDIHGEHGGGTWGAQHIPLIIAGPGVRRGHSSPFPARLMDVAPTVLALLGMKPERMDGVVLAGALTRPTNAQTRHMEELAPKLMTYQRAIVARSKADLAGQGGVTEPPPKVS